MTPHILIEPLSAKHIEGFHGALDLVARERRFLTLLEAPPLEEIREYVLNGLTSGTVRWVALAGDVVGWCDISRHRHLAHAHRGTLGIGLVPPFRGRGIGRRLLAATLDDAWRGGLTRVELAVHGDNATAIALYEKAGFAREGVARQASRIDGCYRDAILMAIVR